MELEWKYACDESLFPKLKKRAADWQTIEMETVYYDTPARALSQRRWTFRLRRENGEAVACLKTPAGERARGEWEALCEDVVEAVPALLAQGAPTELEKLVREQGLEPVCGARFTRQAATVAVGNTTVELALDAGVLSGGGRTVPLCEVEVELKSGDPGEAESFAAALAGEYGLREEPRSKFQRAFSLTQTSKSEK